MMNFENQLCKQTGEQPAYIDNENLLRMQRASLVRFERNERCVHALPLFFSLADDMAQQFEKVLQSISVIQKCHFQTSSDAELGALVSGMVRSARGLPLVLKNDPTFGSSSRGSAIGTKTTYDLVYHVIGDSIDMNKIAADFVQSFNPDLKIMEMGNSIVVYDETIDQELVGQKKRTFEAAQADSVPAMEEVETPNCSTIEELAEFTQKGKTDLVKAVMYSVNKKLVFVNIRGDLDVSEEKLRQHLGLVDSPTEIQMAPPELLEKHGLVPGYAGLVGMKPADCTILCDNSVKTVTCGVTGANHHGYHFVNFNLARDVKKDVIKCIKYCDVAADPVPFKGAVVAQFQDCCDFYPDFTGLDNKPAKIPMYKITVRMMDLIGTTLGKTKKLSGAYVINIGKDTTKLDATINELRKFVSPVAIVVDNRAKPNFGGKMQLAEMSMFKNVIIVSTKLDADTVAVNETPTKIADLHTLFA